MASHLPGSLFLFSPKKSCLVSGNWPSEIFFHLPARIVARVSEYIFFVSNKKVHREKIAKETKESRKTKETKEEREKENVVASNI